MIDDGVEVSQWTLLRLHEEVDDLAAWVQDVQGRLPRKLATDGKLNAGRVLSLLQQLEEQVERGRQ